MGALLLTVIGPYHCFDMSLGIRSKGRFWNCDPVRLLVISKVPVQYPFIQAVDIEVLDLGSQPPAIGGAKSYSAANDEAILEAPVLWGGDARVRASVRIKVGQFVLYLPVEVRNLQVDTFIMHLSPASILCNLGEAVVVSFSSHEIACEIMLVPVLTGHAYLETC